MRTLQEQRDRAEIRDQCAYPESRLTRVAGRSLTPDDVARYTPPADDVEADVIAASVPDQAGEPAGPPAVAGGRVTDYITELHRTLIGEPVPANFTTAARACYEAAWWLTRDPRKLDAARARRGLAGAG